MGADTYRGLPLDELRIDAVDWAHGAQHLRTRTDRYGSGELDLEPEWATEASLDPRRIVRATKSKSLEVIGWSESAPPRRDGDGGRLLKVWLVPKRIDHGEWWGASACPANERDRRNYEEANANE